MKHIKDCMKKKKPEDPARARYEYAVEKLQLWYRTTTNPYEKKRIEEHAKKHGIDLKGCSYEAT